MAYFYYSKKNSRALLCLSWEGIQKNQPVFHSCNLFFIFSSPSFCPLLLTIFQVWFQNRRAKFRRNERAMLANKNASLLKSYSGDVTAVEQPIVPRPAPRPTDYLSWGTASPYR
jgi:hypothetical protein